jgi:5-methylthioadenosine/S-adenosylhomocysteine deaminase
VHVARPDIDHCQEKAMARTVLINGTVVTQNDRADVFEPGAVAWETNRITYIGPVQGFSITPEDHIVDIAGRLVLPGLVNAHTHTAMTYQRGLVEDVTPQQWFARTAALEAQMSEEDLYWSALLGCYEMIRNGITCVADRFSHMEVVGEAVATSGLRAVLGPSLYDIGRQASLSAATALVKHWGSSPENRISCGLAPVAPDLVSSELLRDIRAAADKLGARIFIHVAQTQHELDEVRRRGFEGSVQYLHALGFLGPDVVAAHCLYLSETEIAMLAETGTKVAHCPTSNAKIEARVAPVGGLLAHGVEVGLGTDCASCNNTMDLFEEMKIAALLLKVAHGQPTAHPVEGILRMATRSAARVLGLEAQVGSLEVGKRADIITLDRRGLHFYPRNNLFADLVYSAKGADVRDVFVDGRLLVRDGEIFGADLDEARSRALARHLRAS